MNDYIGQIVSKVTRTRPMAEFDNLNRVAEPPKTGSNLAPAQIFKH